MNVRKNPDSLKPTPPAFLHANLALLEAIPKTASDSRSVQGGKKGGKGRGKGKGKGGADEGGQADPDKTIKVKTALQQAKAVPR